MESIYLLAVLAALFYIWLRRRVEHFQHFKKRGINGPEPSFLFGNGIEIWRKSQPSCYVEWKKKFGYVYGYFNGSIPVLVVSNKALIKDILVSKFSAFMDRGNLFGGGLKNALPNLKGQRWKHVRSTLTPSFTTSKLKAVSESMADIVDEFMSHMAKAANTSEDFNIHKLLQALTTDVICRLGLGINYGVIKNPDHPIMGRLTSLFRVTLNPVLVFLFSFPFLSFLIVPALGVMQMLKNSSDPMTNPAKSIMEDCKKVVEARRQNPTARRNDLLQLLLDATYQIRNDKDLSIDDENEQKESVQGSAETNGQPGLTDEEVIENAWIIMVAGYETTANTLSSISYVLMRNPEIQDKLRQELQENIKDKNNIEFGVLHKLPYLDAVIKEALRMYSPAIALTREALRDVEVQGLKIKKGDFVAIPIDAIHKADEFFEQPQEFRPERFINGEVDPITYIAFGNGPRNCIGMRFSQMEMKLTLAKILLNYRLEPCTKTPTKYELVGMVGISRYDGELYAKVTHL